MRTGRRQQGLSIVGFVLVAAFVAMAAVVGFKMLPAYIEYFSVQKAVRGALDDAVDGQPATVRRFFERRINADYIDSVRWQDLEVTKENNQIVGRIEWEKRLPLIANVSLVIDFEVAEKR